MKKRVLIFAIILVNVITLFMPLTQAKADTLDETEFWEVYDYIVSETANARAEIDEKMGILSAIAMAGVGYVDFTEDFLRHAGNWAIDKMAKSVEYAKLTGQWALDKYCDILNYVVGWDGELDANKLDWRVINSLYTDEEWNSLLDSWTTATSHADNFISFDDVTDDIEGWADKYYYAYYADKNMMEGSYQVVVKGMSASLRASILNMKPILFSYMTGTYPNDSTVRKFINKAVTAQSKYITKVVYERSQSGYWYAYFYWNDGTKTQSVSSYITSGTGTLYTYTRGTVDGVATQLYDWSTPNLSNPGAANTPNSWSGNWNEETARTYVYNWYHTNTAGNARICNISFYYLDPTTGIENPFSVHPGTPLSWVDPVQDEPVMVGNDRAMYMNSNITGNWADLKNAVLNNSNIIQNIGDGDIYLIILPNPDFIEDPTEPEENEVTPTPTPDINIPYPPYDVNIISPLPLPVIIQEPSVTPTPDPGWGLDLPDVDFELPDITIPDIDDLTTSANIEGTVLYRTLEAENENDEDITYANVTGWLFAGIPNNQMIWLWIFAFVCLVVTLLFRR